MNLCRVEYRNDDVISDVSTGSNVSLVRHSEKSDVLLRSDVSRITSRLRKLQLARSTSKEQTVKYDGKVKKVKHSRERVRESEALDWRNEFHEELSCCKI